MGKAWAVIVAAGAGRRFGAAKQFALLKGRPLYEWSVEAFEQHEDVEGIILVLPAEGAGRPQPALGGKLRAVVAGGKERQDSVLNGFRRVPAGEDRVVLVHDGARPLVSRELISRVIQAAGEKGAAVPGLPIEDTIKEAAGDEVIRTLQRTALVKVQTPQGFLYSWLGQALEGAAAGGFYATDEAMLVERTGRRVVLVAGDVRNIKITTPLDLKIAEAMSDD
ncbi:MAG: 2-C-methyl-D-erythritol 4-phosphate cytidylyltransferase [Candidatus Aminicenantales bacterium]